MYNAVLHYHYDAPVHSVLLLLALPPINRT